ncbi:uncharacterized protein TRUGW13939_11409 [Talaromyces rugulosus]|uniref:FAD-binding PCMH-type domain-containing protein n=1 Tax=Talaromyces rugulosus TaxID=121627 RepID=A0A7H8RDD8_TALRU|nr:uncharacterized protein TRUGW13939_11409 [Talaromyces rugulosus]QKX64236.1 hypothetical protein TRUGW13939_11409 [Talaromyces rugulosus]
MLLDSKNVGQTAIALLALGSPTAATSLSTVEYSTGTPPCDAIIQAGLGHRLLFATDPQYEPRIESYWALNPRRRPYCLAQPHTPQEVSTIMTALLEVESAGDWSIAVRAGGHNIGHTNNIDTGVTIDLEYLNQTTYSIDTNVASVSPGSHWQDVYAELHKHGVVVTGGRDGDVGVGGFLLGGGSTYYMAQTGFGCDSIVNYEVVLINGSIINANSTANSDLWRALKGGGSNFGIVTRYDMEALDDKKLAHGTRTIAGNHTAQFLSAVVDFTNSQQKYNNDALVPYLLHAEGEDFLETIEVNLDGDTASPGFEKFRQIPSITPFTQNVEPLSVAAANSTVSGSSWYVSGGTLTFRNDEKILNYAAKVHKEYAQAVDNAIGKKSYVSTIFLQPLPSFFAEISEEKGGNMFAGTMKGQNSVLWTATSLVYTNQSDLAVVESHMREMTAKLKSYSVSVDGDNDLIYLNYADSLQDPLGSYPKENVEHMKQVAAKYDPEGKFQTRFPGGFKISRVDDA